MLSTHRGHLQYVRAYMSLKPARNHLRQLDTKANRTTLFGIASRAEKGGSPMIRESIRPSLSPGI